MDELESVDGAQHLLAKIDEYWKQTDTDDAFANWEKFLSVIRAAEMPMDQ